LRASAVVAGLLVALSTGCETPPADRVPERVPGANVVVIGIDTLRADHLGCYGYGRPTSPRLDALGAESVVFANAIAQAPWTLPSFASMLTGLLPSSHRAGEGSQIVVSRLPPDRDTIATILHREGYATGSFVSNGYVGKDVGLAEGYDAHVQNMRSQGAVEPAIAWLRAHRTDRLFAFVHIVDPHGPWTASREHEAPFVDPTYAGPIDGTQWGPADPAWSDADRRRIVDLYDAEVHYADSLAGRIVEVLAELGLLGRTLVVVAADHGEELLERGAILHGHTLYDELLHVPLIVRWPGGGRRGRVTAQVRMMDVTPTILDAVGVAVPAGLDGVSLLDAIHGKPPPAVTRYAFAEYLDTPPQLKAIRTAEWKYVLNPTTGIARLFDLKADPDERHDVVATEAECATELRTRLESRLLARLEGFHFLVRGETAPHHVRVELRTATRFVGVSLSEPEPEDRFTLSADGRALDVDLQVGARRQSMGGDLFDDDGVRFQTADGAEVEMRALVDDVPLAADRLALAFPWLHPPSDVVWRFAPGDAKLRVPYPDPPLRTANDLGLALKYVDRPRPPTAVLDEKTRENLRALGYIQ
jgi:arylsulfatase A-like enzyme